MAISRRAAMEWLVPEQLAQLALGTLERPLPGIAQSPADALDVEVEHMDIAD
jgi:hypothetical protein